MNMNCRRSHGYLLANECVRRDETHFVKALWQFHDFAAANQNLHRKKMCVHNVLENENCKVYLIHFYRFKMSRRNGKRNEWQKEKKNSSIPSKMESLIWSTRAHSHAFIVCKKCAADSFASIPSRLRKIPAKTMMIIIITVVAIFANFFFFAIFSNASHQKMTFLLLLCVSKFY